jgi:hypothetical protein
MLTGEPRHTSHDDGEWLQSAVDTAIAQGDAVVERLARRASVPLLVRVSSPVSSVRKLPALVVDMPMVLKVPAPVSYRADLSASVDGEELTSVGTFRGASSTNIGILLPQPAMRPGLHLLRVTARITYAVGSNLPPETRHLPAIVYAIYDPDARSSFDAGYFLDSARNANARRLDPSLPDGRFEVWLQSILDRHEGKFDPATGWQLDYCDSRTTEPGLPPRIRDICAIAWFQVKDGHSGIGQAWIRTGRVELAGGDVRWLAEPPAFEGLTLRRSEFETLSALPALLTATPETWPAADLSIAPEDVAVARQGNAVRVTATIRNSGAVNARGALVSIATTTDGRVGPRRSFVVDVPKGGSTSVRVALPFDNPYGAVVVDATPMSEHAPHDLWLPDPTPEDSVAFRIVNPRLAPHRYVELLTSHCGFICRGY